MTENFFPKKIDPKFIPKIIFLTKITANKKKRSAKIVSSTTLAIFVTPPLVSANRNGTALAAERFIIRARAGMSRKFLFDGTGQTCVLTSLP